MRIDAHHHFWRYTPAEYGWIDEPMAAIRRDFMPADLQAEIHAARIDQVISVQTRQSVEETAWLLSLADAHPWIAGVVGWVPLVQPGVGAVLDRFAARPRFRGVRHILQAEPDAYMERDDFSLGLTEVRRLGLTYDLLVLHHQLPAAMRLVDRHPDLTVVLDHIAKPAIGRNEIEPWRTHLEELARRPNVFCKLSGMVTEADHCSWTEEQLRPYVDAALEAFGPARLIFGSDWPVCRVAIRYTDWVELLNRLLSGLSVVEREDIFGNTARRAYGL